MEEDSSQFLPANPPQVEKSNGGIERREESDKNRIAPCKLDHALLAQPPPSPEQPEQYGPEEPE